jgi:hypothetical protein
MATTTRAPKKSPARKGDLRVGFILADDIRLEHDGKVTAVGLYTDNVIVALMRPGQPEPSAEAPIAVGGIAFIVSIGGLAGTHRVWLEYKDASLPKEKTTALRARDYEFPNAAMTVNLVGRFQPLITGSFGTKRVVVHIDDQSRVCSFEVRRGVARGEGGELVHLGAGAPVPKAVAKRRPTAPRKK